MKDPLVKLGFNRWFQDQVEKLYNPQVQLARVVVVNRDQYILRDADGEFVGVVTKKFIKSVDSTADLPCVGDWVCVKHSNPPERSTITNVLTRQTFLRRKALKKKAEYQMIASNLDMVFVVESCSIEFNIERLERYVMMAEEGGVEPVLILTKIDLISDKELNKLVEKIRDHDLKLKIIPISNKTGEGVDQVRNLMESGKTYCLVGSSGVGKTTLIKDFVGNSQTSSELRTNTVSKNGEGRHTTVRRELLVLKDDVMLVDTPGMRGITVEVVEEPGVNFEELAGECKFSDCSHKKEPGCAIVKAVESGGIEKEEYKEFLRKNKPYKMSYAEKSNKGKGKKK
ncbi:MAG: ribosome small subunit-dependent GTPase A [Bdellovibrionales bacterium]